MYRVIAQFADAKDNNHIYRAGDEFPRQGVKVEEERLDELASGSNAIGRPLIEKVSAPKRRRKGE